MYQPNGISFVFALVSIIVSFAFILLGLASRVGVVNLGEGLRVVPPLTGGATSSSGGPSSASASSSSTTAGGCAGSTIDGNTGSGGGIGYGVYGGGSDEVTKV